MLMEVGHRQTGGFLSSQSVGPCWSTRAQYRLRPEEEEEGGSGTEDLQPQKRKLLRLLKLRILKLRIPRLRLLKLRLLKLRILKLRLRIPRLRLHFARCLLGPSADGCQTHQAQLQPSQASEVTKRLFGLTPAEIRSLPSYDDQNFYVGTAEGGEYVLKIMNSEDSKNVGLIEIQTHAMSFLRQKGLPAQTALPTTSGLLTSLEETDCGYGNQKYLVRLLTYLPGTTISKVPLTAQLLFEAGKTAARMDTVLQEMEHPLLGLLQREKFIWSLSNVPDLEGFLGLLDGEPLQEVVKSVIHQYKTSVVPKRTDFRKCINHGDFNDLNVLVQPDEGDGHRISGILDFGDMNAGYYVYELAIAIMYMMTEHPDPVEVGGPVLAGWESVLPLEEAERESLYVLVLSRFCQSLVLARHSVAQHPENAEYLLISSRRGVHILRQLWELGKERVEEAWFQGAARHRDRK